MKYIKWIGIITIVAIFLKIVEIISLSWLWILSPIWLPMVIEVMYVGGVRILEWLLDNNNQEDKDEQFYSMDVVYIYTLFDEAELIIVAGLFGIAAEICAFKKKDNEVQYGTDEHI